MYREGLSDPTLVRTRQELDVAMANADKARKVVFELFQDLDGFNLGDYRKLDDEGRNMTRLVTFLREASSLAGYSYREETAGDFTLTSERGTWSFTREREKALKEESLQLAGLEHPVVTEIIDACRRVLSESSALMCISPVSDVSGCLGVWDVTVTQPGGKSLRMIQLIGVSDKGERETRFEKVSWAELRPTSCPLELSGLQEASRTILNRALEFSGIVGEGATYSAQPLAMMGFVSAG